MKKLINNLVSIKLWILVLCTILLLMDRINQSIWMYIVLGLLGYREMSNVRHSLWGNREQGD